MLRVLLLLSMPSTSQRKVYSILHVQFVLQSQFISFILYCIYPNSPRPVTFKETLSRNSQPPVFFSKIQPAPPHVQGSGSTYCLAWVLFLKDIRLFLKTANNLCNFAVEYMQLENKNHCGFFSKTMRGQGEVDPDREDFLRWSLGAKYSQQYFLNIF